jgi:phosphatidylglycerol:prolipoprotein diacylglycerol transferase
MYPTIFRLPIFHIPIYGYGLMMVFAFLGTQWLSSKLAKTKGLDPEIFVNVALIALISGVVGSRMSHVLENWAYYTNPHLSAWDNFVNMINIRSGGLTFYGGLVLAAPFVLGYLMYRKVTPRMAMDICAPCITLGLAIGRIGCFLNGCCYGAPANVPWAMSFPYNSNAYVDAVDDGKIVPPIELRVPTTGDHFRLVSNEELQQGYVLTGDPHEPRMYLDPNAKAVAAAQHSPAVHPAQLYSTITSLLMTALLLAYFFQPHTGGRVFALMLILEGPSRYLLEMLRVEPTVLTVRVLGYLIPMSLSMVIGLILLVIGVVLWIALGTVKEKSPGFAVLQPA